MVARSVDGIHWEYDLHPEGSCEDEPYPPSCENWQGGVTFGGGTWLSGGGNGSLMASQDGARTWQGLHPDPRPPAIRGMAYAADHFFLIADDGVVGVSNTKGESWTLHELGSSVSDIAASPSAVFAYGRDGCFASYNNGDSFAPCPGDIAGVSNLAFGDDQWVARVSGGYKTSNSGESFSATFDADHLPTDLAYGDGAWFGYENGTVYSSQDLATWQALASDLPDYSGALFGWILPKHFPIEGVNACADTR